MISITDIQKIPYQPRKEFDREKLDELAQSIKENGVIQPIIVRQSPVIGYEILAGERRYRASLLAGLTSIPAVVKQLSDQEMMVQSIIENLQRENFKSNRRRASKLPYRNVFIYNPLKEIVLLFLIQAN